LQYYLEHAIPPSFYWAWGASDLEYQAFRTLIRRSDDAYRTATQVLGVVLVNHVVSAVDALILARLRERGSGDGGPGLQSGFESGPNGLRWTVQASVRF
jgi:hypothetical protein